jgi:hypothetical protein
VAGVDATISIPVSMIAAMAIVRRLISTVSDTERSVVQPNGVPLKWLMTDACVSDLLSVSLLLKNVLISLKMIVVMPDVPT